jgi:protein-S-isoprenylcysteine O-methyltransferase Ste14
VSPDSPGDRLTGRGAPWVIAQGPLLLAAILLPVMWRPTPFGELVPPWLAGASRVVGVSGSVVSIAVVARAKFVLGKGLVVFPEPPDDAVLKQDDIYGIVRHPVYAAVIGATLSWALLWVSVPGVLFSIPIALFFRLKARYEEKLLTAKFPEYTTYQARVPALVPRRYGQATG